MVVAMTYLATDEVSLTCPEFLPPHEGWPVSVHDFTKRQSFAVNTALAAGRPLLVRGEPGTGKTQLARAAAVRLKRNFVFRALTAHTDVQDLFFSIDAVRRLSEAQIYGAATPIHLRDSSAEQLREFLAEKRFVRPGELWWGFDWKDAATVDAENQGIDPRPSAPWVRGDGTVILLDEIDKADPILPNALLEALGTGRFDGPPGRRTIEKKRPEPLVIITTNQERDLPQAFIRRCVVVDLSLPTDEGELLRLLVWRGKQHAEAQIKQDPEMGPGPTEELLEKAATQLIRDRSYYRSQDLPQPGQAEYLDLVRALCRLTSDEDRRLQLLKDIQGFVLRKDPAGRPS